MTLNLTYFIAASSVLVDSGDESVVIKRKLMINFSVYLKKIIKKSFFYYHKSKV